MAPTDTIDIVGQGIAFPARIDERGRVALVSGVAAIESALTLILSTAPGERVMRPAFGCRIWELAFGLLDANALGLLEHLTREAIALWEPRVDVVAVRACVDADAPNLVHLDIQFTVKATNDRRNLVYPFYVLPE